MLLSRHSVETLLRQMSGRRIGELRGYLRQRTFGQVPLLQFILAITDFEQSVGTFTRLRIFVDHTLKSSLRFLERLVDVVGLAQPILSVVRERTVRINDHVLLKRRDGTTVLT